MSNKRWVHWFVLLSLILGQLAMNAGLAFAQTPDGSQAKVPVCTSTGIVYMSWPDRGVTETGEDQQSDSGANWDANHAGTCIWCTVSPTQLRLDLHSDLVIGRLLVDDARATTPPAITPQALPGNPYATPRAPPLA